MGTSKPRRDATEETEATHTLSSDSRLQISEKVSFCCFSHPACGSLLQQPPQTDAGRIPPPEWGDEDVGEVNSYLIGKVNRT